MSAPDDAQAAPPTLLIVDDQPDNRFVLKELVRAELPECRVVLAGSGTEGVVRLQTEPISGALVDVQMPGMDGLDFCRQAKRRPDTARVPILLLTSHNADGRLRAAGLEAGAVDFVNRPIDNVELAARIRVLLRMRRAEDELRHMNERLEGLVAERTRQLQDQAQRLAQAEKMEALGTLAGGIAHDFNNLLTPILGFCQLALGELEDDNPLADDLEAVVEAARRAQELVQQILTFSRRVDFEPSPLRIQPVVKEAVKLLRNLVPSSITLQTDLEAGDAQIVAAPVQVHQIVMNLGSNAYQAFGEEAGEIWVRLQPVQLAAGEVPAEPPLPAGPFLLLVVEDSGPGIPAEIRGRIFDPFFTTKPQGQGTGMGLATVHGIVQSLSGHIRVECPPEGGTRFEVLLPVTEAAVEEDNPFTEQELRGSERVLIVDDDEAVLRVTERCLAGFGYQTRVAHSAAEALALFESDEALPDLVVTDIAMPNMTGTQLLKLLRHRVPELPVLLVTGYSKDVVSVAGDPRLARLVKPFVPAEIGRAVRQLLDA